MQRAVARAAALARLTQPHAPKTLAHGERRLLSSQTAALKGFTPVIPYAEVATDFPLVLGGSLAEVHVRIEQFGREDAGPDDTVLVLPSFSYGSHARSLLEDPTPGWWEGIVGDSLGVDTRRFRVVCASILGSPLGSTNPTTVNPATGKRYGPAFPQITPADQAHCHARVLDYLGLDYVHAVVGASLGGMQALEFAAESPERAKRIVSIVATPRTSPGSVALRRVQRAAVLSDPLFKDGHYDPEKPPEHGLSVARELGMICYRSRREFDARFSWDHAKSRAERRTTPPCGSGTASSDWAHKVSFEVESYLAAQGKKFGKKFDANAYLLLSKCMDLMDLGHGSASYEEGVLRIPKGLPLLVMPVTTDMLIPAEESVSLVQLLRRNGRTAYLDLFDTKYGHDAFLREFWYYNPRLKRFLEADDAALPEMMEGECSPSLPGMGL